MYSINKCFITNYNTLKQFKCLMMHFSTTPFAPFAFATPRYKPLFGLETFNEQYVTV